MCEVWDYAEELWLTKGIEQGIQQGIQQVQEQLDRINKLNLLLLGEKRYDDLERCARNEQYREELMERYGLIE